MAAEEQITGGSDRARWSRGSPARKLVRRAMWRLAPAYARRRARRVGEATSAQRLEAELDRVRERHGEQIERLEDLARELVHAVESLRREIADREDGGA
jgi:hypothetical protein